MPSFDLILNAFVTLFVTVDPIGNTPLFLGITIGLSTKERRAVALRGVAVAFVILALFAITGTSILDAMGISTPTTRRTAGFAASSATAFAIGLRLLGTLVRIMSHASTVETLHFGLIGFGWSSRCLWPPRVAAKRPIALGRLGGIPVSCTSPIF